MYFVEGAIHGSHKVQKFSALFRDHYSNAPKDGSNGTAINLLHLHAFKSMWAHYIHTYVYFYSKYKRPQVSFTCP